MSQFNSRLMHRLEGKGINAQDVPGFIRSLVQVLAVYPQLSLGEINRILCYLGWDDVDLDYHTFQLVIANLKPHQSIKLELSNPSILH